MVIMAPTMAPLKLLVNGQALSFDGNANNVSISHGSSLELGLEDFTVSLWIKSDILATKQVIIDKTDGTTGFS